MDRLPRSRAMDAAVTRKHDAADLLDIAHPVLLQSRDQFLQRELAFIQTDDVHTIGEVMVAPFGCIRAAGQYKLDSVGFGEFCQIGLFRPRFGRQSPCIHR